MFIGIIQNNNIFGKIMVTGVLEINSFSSFLLYRNSQLILQFFDFFLFSYLLHFLIIGLFLYFILFCSLSFPWFIPITSLVTFGRKLSIDMKLVKQLLRL